jgi:hypothetical protein
VTAHDVRNSLKGVKLAHKLLEHSYDYVGVNNPISPASIKNKDIFSDVGKSADLQDHLHAENSQDLSQIICMDNSDMVDINKNLEAKLQRFQQDLGEKVHNESILENQIKKLRIEVDSLTKLLKDNDYYTDLKGSISNISEVILNPHKNINLNEENQVILQKLICDSTIDKTTALKTQNKALCDNLQGLKQKIKEEIKRCHEAYGLARKYISTIKTCHKMQKDYVDISNYIENADMDTVEDLECIENLQLQSTQNNILIRAFTSEKLEYIHDDNPANLLQNALVDKDKQISRLNLELKIVNKSKRRNAHHMKHFKSGIKNLGDEVSVDDSDDRLSNISAQQVLRSNDMFQQSDYKK